MRSIGPENHLYFDAEGHLTYLGPGEWHLGLIMEQWPKVVFNKTREHAADAVASL